MDNFGNSKILPDEDRNKPIPFDDSGTGDVGISHSPLNLGGGTAEVPKVKMVAGAAGKPAEKIVSAERITGIKTFFTKLHAGSLNFLDEQITNWLKNNPGITIKRINTVTGEVQGKKTEPNIIVTIWY